MLNSALDLVRAECELHEAVAPDRAGTGEWKKKVQLLERAIEWLRQTHAMALTADGPDTGGR